MIQNVVGRRTNVAACRSGDFRIGTITDTTAKQNCSIFLQITSRTLAFVHTQTLAPVTGEDQISLIRKVFAAEESVGQDTPIFCKLFLWA